MNKTQLKTLIKEEITNLFTEDNGFQLRSILDKFAPRVSELEKNPSNFKQVWDDIHAALNKSRVYNKEEMLASFKATENKLTTFLFWFYNHVLAKRGLRVPKDK